MINTVAIMGRLTYEPELRKVQSNGNNISVLSFQVACDRGYQKGNDRKADFIDCVAWNQTADFIAKYFHKGSMIAVEGSIRTESYTDQSGARRKQTQVLASTVSFCGSKSETGTTDAVDAPQPVPQNYVSATDRDFEEIVDDEEDLNLPF